MKIPTFAYSLIPKAFSCESKSATLFTISLINRAQIVRVGLRLKGKFENPSEQNSKYSK